MVFTSFEKTRRWNDQNGNPKYFLATVRAVSEHKRAEEALEKYQREIEQQKYAIEKSRSTKDRFP